MKLSIIIPAYQDEDISMLITSLQPLKAHEIIIATEGSRAQAMNSAVQQSTGNILWFLHADSHISAAVIERIQTLIKNPFHGLYYFDLSFLKGSPLMKLNEIGVFIRCRLFKLPFGDQGFVLHKNDFLKAQGYNEQTPYGEDHLFIWQAKRVGISIQAIGIALQTSARKYQEYGWLKTTIQHQFLFYKQVWQQLKKRGIS